MSAITTNIFADADELARSVASRLVERTRAEIGSKGYSTIALAGGSTPRHMYQLLATAEFRNQIEWEQVHFFLGDERYVPLDHPDSNFLMAKEALLNHVPVDESNIYPVQTELDPATAARNYETEIRKVTGTNPPSFPEFDLVLLGIGDDGHTASLFPGTAALHIHDRLVIENEVPQQGAMRITFTVPLLQAAREVVLLASGAGKAEAVYRAVEGTPDIQETPTQVLRDARGRVIFALDRDAAGRLSR
jgi:6-phosphogluconolactonase